MRSQDADAMLCYVTRHEHKILKGLIYSTFLLFYFSIFSTKYLRFECVEHGKSLFGKLKRDLHSKRVRKLRSSPYIMISRT